ncbi:hypothetical protein PGT21_026178 [Puccinia graminis f. sp. tritici]|uniref:Cutinase n=2 Tax=Puccinia graminis f. sp. tritici TaxID=56615 RepID=E3KTZ7_PUCGT|nr:uncharacterized protein PGTG_13478 [Puccinia graminis f. sp. tritici CRL 75-36-700-3]EFP87692.1 hypothetical protein PGTG_13478 [Puccinia graminis f. sp. tritici CRL 75-36-700-3]KAA1101622.1 hypothetical protein PGT21_026178 [Puccinia graminis f. sp. tritici]
MLFPASLTAVIVLFNFINSQIIVEASHTQNALPEVAVSVKLDPIDICGDYQIVAARGTYEPQSGSPTYADLIKIVETTIPRGSNVEIQYPSNMEYVITPVHGATAGVTYLSDQMVKCPKQKYVFVGYSKGAMVISQLMEELPISADKVVAVVLFGNPNHKPDAPQNRCSGTGGFGIAAMFAESIPSQYISLTYDCCIKWDFVCQTIGTVANHMAYRGSQEEKNAAAFVISQLRLKLGHSFRIGA